MESKDSHDAGQLRSPRLVVLLMVVFITLLSLVLLLLLVASGIYFVSTAVTPTPPQECNAEQRSKSWKLDDVLVSVLDFEDYAREHMEQDPWTYFSGGSTTMNTNQDNRDAFIRHRIQPRHLVDVRNATDLSTTVLGKEVKIPIGASPTNYQFWAHPDGDIGNAKAITDAGGIFILTCYSSFPLEEIAAVTPTGRHWQQTYLFANRDITLGLVRKAEVAGYEAIVVTVDSPVFGLSYSLHSVQYPNNSMPNLDDPSQAVMNPGQTWEELRWLRSQTELPLILKGIMNAEDVNEAIDAGVQAIMVSNHGGRSLDGFPATIDVLPSIVEAVAGRVEVYLDSGVRTGMDVFKGLALGARMVFVGRAPIWGLYHSGQEGVEAIYNILKTELSNTMAFAGAGSVEDSIPGMVIKPSSSLP